MSIVGSPYTCAKRSWEGVTCFFRSPLSAALSKMRGLRYTPHALAGGIPRFFNMFTMAKEQVLQISQTGIPGLVVLEPKVHGDSRGFFLETFRQDFLEQAGLPCHFVQDNHAKSEHPGVLRGLHYQLPPTTQAKLVWVTQGAAYDVAVDLRTGSPTYGKWFSITLSAANFKRLLVPRGFAHGYMTLEPGTEFQYKVDAYYAPEMEAGIRWDDPDLAIPWPDIPPILSDKDKTLPGFSELNSPFRY